MSAPFTIRKLHAVLGVVFLSAAFAALSISFLLSASATVDEGGHFASGYTSLKWHDYRIAPDHPPFARKFAALPLLTQATWPDDLQMEDRDFSEASYVDSKRMLHLMWATALEYPNSQWNFAHEFLYGIRDTSQRRIGADNPLLISPEIPLKPGDFNNDANQLLILGRFSLLTLGLLLGLLIFSWAREMHRSSAAGILALALFAFDPNFIAHSALITTDVAASLFIFASVYAFWHLSRKVDGFWILVFLLSLGLAFASKFSAVFLLPIFILLGLFKVFSGENWKMGLGRKLKLKSKPSKFLLLSSLAILAALTTYLSIWGIYDFRYSAAFDLSQAAIQETKTESIIPPLKGGGRKPGTLPIAYFLHRAAAARELLLAHPDGDFSEAMIDEKAKTSTLGLTGECLIFANEHQLFPEAFIAGFALADANSIIRPCFLMGEFSNTGFKTYFLWTFLLKTPIPTLIAIGFGIFLIFQDRKNWLRKGACLLIPILVILAFVLPSHMNIGHRHLLPIYPFLYVLAGGVALKLDHYRPAAQKWIATGSLILIAISSSLVFSPFWRPQLIYPHYLAYFNELAGGPLNGWRSLVDSNIDWGQDLKGLKLWLDKNPPGKPIYFSYFGTADPRYYSIPYISVPKELGGYPATSQSSPIKDTATFKMALRSGDLFAISIQNMVGPMLSPEARRFWTEILRDSTFVDQVGYSIYIYRYQRKS